MKSAKEQVFNQIEKLKEQLVQCRAIQIAHEIYEYLYVRICS